jgi:hypothetical protein
MRPEGLNQFALSSFPASKPAFLFGVEFIFALFTLRS